VDARDQLVFGWSVGLGSLKATFFPPSQDVWRASREGGPLEIIGPDPLDADHRVAIVGARPCDAAALGILDGVLRDGAVADPSYRSRRLRSFLVVAECTSPSATCFCSSMGTGPEVAIGFDLALTEVQGHGEHRFVVRVGSPEGAEVMAHVAHRDASDEDLQERRHMIDVAASSFTRHLQTEGLAELLRANIEHPRWEDIAQRCLSCANCTMVCPTCFCSDVTDTSDLTGDLTRRRTWSSCFDLEHSFVHGGPVRASSSSRYRQWMTHKLSTWWDQFATSGCVGCGRCITWCPVGIDITDEAAMIRSTSGATGVAVPVSRRTP
jgi:ferredoxin